MTLHSIQTSLFDATKLVTQKIKVDEGQFELYENFMPPAEGSLILKDLIDNIDWKQNEILVYNRRHLIPRMEAWHGDKNARYTYSGVKLNPLPWTPLLLSLKSRVDEAAGLHFNSVLLNYYRNGKDHVGWHSDDEKELGTNPIIGSLSFGGTRRFVLKHKSKKVPQLIFNLSHGTLLVMRGATQHHWQHCIPKSLKDTESRVNLTFRLIKCVTTDKPE